MLNMIIKICILVIHKKAFKMPATTRSQSNKVINQKSVISMTKEKKDNKTENFERFFVDYIAKMLKTSDSLRRVASIWQSKAKAEEYKSVQMYEFYSSKYKQAYYENVRIITEIYYAVSDWFDTVLVTNGVVKQQKLLDIFYHKYCELKIQLMWDVENPTEEEKKILYVFFNLL